MSGFAVRPCPSRAQASRPRRVLAGALRGGFGGNSPAISASDPAGADLHPAARLGRLRRRLPVRAGHAAAGRRREGAAERRAGRRPAAHVQRRSRRARASVGAPSIVTVYQAGISADGRPYIVMEFCPGSLAQRYRIERIPVEEVLTIGVKMASALESAHRAGLVHRDVKPSNILVTTFGRRCWPTSASRPRCRARPPMRCSRCRSRGAPPR